MASEKKAKHQRIADYVRRQIEENRFPPRHMLESEAELCERFGVSRGPVRQALLALEQEGRIYRVSGRGSFVRDLQEKNSLPVLPTSPASHRGAEAAKGTRLWVFPIGNSATPSHMLEGLLGGIDEKAAEYGVTLTVGSLASPGTRALVERGDLAGIFAFALYTEGLDDPIYKDVPKIWMMTPREPWKHGWKQQWDTVGADNDAIGGMAAQYLIERGHRNLAFLNLVVEDPSATNRLTGFMYAGRAMGATIAILDDSSEPAEKRPAAPYPISGDLANLLVDRLLALNPRPTGVFLPSDTMTAVIQPILQRRGIKVGKEMELISCNNYAAMLAPLDPRPATIDMNCPEIGRCAADLMAFRMESANAGFPVVSLFAPPLLVEPLG